MSITKALNFFVVEIVMAYHGLLSLLKVAPTAHADYIFLPCLSDRIEESIAVGNRAFGPYH